MIDNKFINILQTLILAAIVWSYTTLLEVKMDLAKLTVNYDNSNRRIIRFEHKLTELDTKFNLHTSEDFKRWYDAMQGSTK